MDNRKKQNNQASLLNHLGNSSKHIVEHHHRDNLSEFVLHDLCSDRGFNIRKAAYLVNNPDFSCLKGVTGYYHTEIFSGDTWQNPKDFSSHMLKSSFNQHVRSYTDASLPAINSKDFSKKQLHALVDFLEIEDAAYHIWQSKHNNQGLFIFERPQDIAVADEHLYNFLHMLSFCPVF